MIPSSVNRPTPNRFVVWLTFAAVLVLLAAGTVGLWGLGIGVRRIKPISSPPSQQSSHSPMWTDAETWLSPVQRDIAKGFRPADLLELARTDTAVTALLEQLEQRISLSVARARESVVALEYTAADAPGGTRRVASGVVINEHGEILSIRIDAPPEKQASAHERKALLIVARDFSGRCHTARWIAADPETGLTLLQVRAGVVRPIPNAPDRPNLGSQVLVLGNPLGMGQTVSRGYIAGLDRTLELGSQQLDGLIQVQTPLYPGDSGAAVVNLRGGWLGLIRSGLAIPQSDLITRTESTRGNLEPVPTSAAGAASMARAEGIVRAAVQCDRRDDFGFAIPARNALWIADQLRARGYVDRAYLGVRLEPPSEPSLQVSSPRELGQGVTPANGEINLVPVPPIRGPDVSLEAPAHIGEGAVLREVLDGTPAAKAGLQPGDRIITLDGRLIQCAHDLTERLDQILARTTIQLRIIRSSRLPQQQLLLSLRTTSRPGAARSAQFVRPAVPVHSTPPVTPTNTLTLSASAATPGSVFAAALPQVRSSQLAATPKAPATRPVPTKHTGPELPALKPTHLQLPFPRAVTERLEHLEQRLDRLESSKIPSEGKVHLQNR
jgi:S1-C subfamily serine protease